LAYTGLDGIPVLGAYEWIPQWGLGVVAELPQADVYADLSSLAPFSRDLSVMYRSLEARVEARTQQIRTAAAVARAVVSTPVLNDLMRRAVELIRDRFGYYHVSIFMLDDEGKMAVL